MCYSTKIQTFSRTKHSQEPSHTIVVSYLSLIKNFIIMWHLSLFYSSSHTLLFEPTNIYAFMPSLVLEQKSISLFFSLLSSTSAKILTNITLSLLLYLLARWLPAAPFAARPALRLVTAWRDTFAIRWLYQHWGFQAAVHLFVLLPH